MDDVINPLLNPDLGDIPDDLDANTEAQRHSEDIADEAATTGGLSDSLNRLIHVLHEGQEVYRQAAERTESDWLQGLLKGYSSQREQFVTELSNLVGGLGVVQDVSSSVSEVLHQAWTDLKAAVVGVSGDDVDILAECESTEDATKEVYEKELLKGLPPHIQDVVQSQYQEIMKAHDQVRELRDSIPH